MAIRVFVGILLLSAVLSAQTVQRLGSQASSGNLAVNGDTVSFGPIGSLGFGTLGIEAAGTWTGTIQVECAASPAGGAFVALLLAPRSGAVSVTSFTANGQWSATISGCQRVRARATAVMTGSAQITMVGAFQ